MADYISREEAILAIQTDCPEQVFYSKEDAIERISSIAAADVKSVRLTVAIPSEKVRDYYGTWGECQSCGYDDNTVGAKYCGGCGAILIWRTNNDD